MKNHRNVKSEYLKDEILKELGAYDIFKYGGWASAVTSRDSSDVVSSKDEEKGKDEIKS
ncbi:MAG: small, acid-soluble spore protein, alpha/beta type [Eubacteriales bacterium]